MSSRLRSEGEKDFYLNAELGRLDSSDQKQLNYCTQPPQQGGLAPLSALSSLLSTSLEYESPCSEFRGDYHVTGSLPASSTTTSLSSRSCTSTLAYRSNHMPHTNFTTPSTSINTTDSFLIAAGEADNDVQAAYYLGSLSSSTCSLSESDASGVNVTSTPVSKCRQSRRLAQLETRQVEATSTTHYPSTVADVLLENASTRETRLSNYGSRFFLESQNKNKCIQSNDVVIDIDSSSLTNANLIWALEKTLAYQPFQAAAFADVSDNNCKNSQFDFLEFKVPGSRGVKSPAPLPTDQCHNKRTLRMQQGNESSMQLPTHSSNLVRPLCSETSKLMPDVMISSASILDFEFKSDQENQVKELRTFQKHARVTPNRPRLKARRSSNLVPKYLFQNDAQHYKTPCSSPSSLKVAHHVATATTQLRKGNTSGSISSQSSYGTARHRTMVTGSDSQKSFNRSEKDGRRQTSLTIFTNSVQHQRKLSRKRHQHSSTSPRVRQVLSSSDLIILSQEALTPKLCDRTTPSQAYKDLTGTLNGSRVSAAITSSVRRCGSVKHQFSSCMRRTIRSGSKYSKTASLQYFTDASTGRNKQDEQFRSTHSGMKKTAKSEKSRWSLSAQPKRLTDREKALSEDFLCAERDRPLHLPQAISLSQEKNEAFPLHDQSIDAAGKKLHADSFPSMKKFPLTTSSGEIVQDDSPQNEFTDDIHQYRFMKRHLSYYKVGSSISEPPQLYCSNLCMLNPHNAKAILPNPGRRLVRASAAQQPVLLQRRPWIVRFYKYWWNQPYGVVDEKQYCKRNARGKKKKNISEAYAAPIVDRLLRKPAIAHNSTKSDKLKNEHQDLAGSCFSLKRQRQISPDTAHHGAQLSDDWTEHLVWRILRLRYKIPCVEAQYKELIQKAYCKKLRFIGLGALLLTVIRFVTFLYFFGFVISPYFEKAHSANRSVLTKHPLTSFRFAFVATSAVAVIIGLLVALVAVIGPTVTGCKNIRSTPEHFLVIAPLLVISADFMACGACSLLLQTNKKTSHTIKGHNIGVFQPLGEFRRMIIDAHVGWFLTNSWFWLVAIDFVAPVRVCMSSKLHLLLFVYLVMITCCVATSYEFTEDSNVVYSVFGGLSGCALVLVATFFTNLMVEIDSRKVFWQSTFGNLQFRSPIVESRMGTDAGRQVKKTTSNAIDQMRGDYQVKELDEASSRFPVYPIQDLLSLVQESDRIAKEVKKDSLNRTNDNSVVLEAVNELHNNAREMLKIITRADGFYTPGGLRLPNQEIDQSARQYLELFAGTPQHRERARTDRFQAPASSAATLFSDLDGLHRRHINRFSTCGCINPQHFFHGSKSAIDWRHQQRRLCSSTGVFSEVSPFDEDNRIVSGRQNFRADSSSVIRDPLCSSQAVTANVVSSSPRLVHSHHHLNNDVEGIKGELLETTNTTANPLERKRRAATSRSFAEPPAARFLVEYRALRRHRTAIRSSESESKLIEDAPLDEATQPIDIIADRHGKQSGVSSITPKWTPSSGTVRFETHVPTLPKLTESLEGIVGVNWDFDVLKVSDRNASTFMEVGYTLLTQWCCRLHFQTSISSNSCAMESSKEDRFQHPSLGVSKQTLLNFLFTIQNLYQCTPYHNQLHGASVGHSMAFLCNHLGLFETADCREKATILVAALCHDVGHPGRNNLFFINSYDQLAIIYNDQAVLENFHAYTTFKTLDRDECDIFENLSECDFRLSRQQIIELILATDMKQHFEAVTHLKVRSSSPDFNPLQTEDRGLTIKLCMKVADLSHALINWEQHFEWSCRITEEFFDQGDEELELHLTQSPLCDRKKHREMAKSQIGFLDFVVKPLTVEIVKLDQNGTMRFLLDILNCNVKKWEDLALLNDVKLLEWPYRLQVIVEEIKWRKKQQLLLHKDNTTATTTHMETHDWTSSQCGGPSPRLLAIQSEDQLSSSNSNSLEKVSTRRAIRQSNGLGFHET